MAWDKLTKWIIGRGLAEKSDRKKLEREYKDVEEALKLIREVANEPILPLPSLPPSACSSPIPDHRKPRTPPILYSERLPYTRSTSSPAIPSLANHQTPTDLFDDTDYSDLKKNFSCDGAWTFKDQPAVPMPEMVGFGRYRRSVNAPTDWQLERAVRSLHDMKGIVIDHLGDCPPLGMGDDVWRDYRAQHSRASSFASSHSSHSHTAATEYLDKSTGTKVSRGFSASTTSSAASSFRDGGCETRRESNMSKTSTTSPSIEGDPKPRRRSGRMSPFSRHASTASISPLAVISELQEIVSKAPRKLEKPCAFDENGNNESAVASGDDDELQWGDMLELDGGSAAGNLTKGLAQRSSASRSKSNARPNLTRQRTKSPERPRSRASTTRRAVLDRSKTIKPTIRASHVRFHGPRKLSDGNKPVSDNPANQITSEDKNLGNKKPQSADQRNAIIAASPKIMPVAELTPVAEIDSMRDSAQYVADVVPKVEHLPQKQQDRGTGGRLSRKTPSPIKTQKQRPTTVCRIVSASCGNISQSTTSSRTVTG
ncbi:hypothetical protein LTR10_011553 [Elasticomyces elasticus]|uniref:Uncharacterized protein n=1 Tax=Exophiala sideris TaxID=1016849 RepID=A0ABR0JD26_9EURO|nr:hypothetical protein LTR10_011553 [Elasticomyces elasticus]KAK5031989.1 hypothetical protein LTS07_004611 [Exophiala sideris]KAK5040918.1 hypothetical protein LTR13_003220 [Exophiala sideris]KAK5061748.1 hypothetical protein LTR69_004930 [Exophiala sideris]KAK5184448.1 hypothetical protein LTR44_003121 [Eurotiomycetes sp. CCFEE 6388]